MIPTFHVVLAALFIIAGTAERCAAAAASDSNRSKGAPIAIGAIRWDAWYDQSGDVGRAVFNTLAPKKWRWRLPFFAQTEGDNVRMAPDQAASMEQEIAFAKAAGINYWAFVAYEPDNPMSNGLALYLASTSRGDVHFAIISEAQQWKADNVGRQSARFADLMKLANYQTVLSGRPLFYILNQDLASVEQAWAGSGGFKAVTKALRVACKERGLPEPYLVAMVPWPEKAKAFADEAGCDAISAYAAQNGGQNAPFRDLAQFTEQIWKRSLETGCEVIPLAMTGWDRRTRVERPVFWEHNEGWDAEITRFYQAPSPEDLTAHLQSAVDWTAAHRAAAEAQTIIVYAWNEHDEGGWLCPTLGEGAARIDAVKRVAH